MTTAYKHQLRNRLQRQQAFLQRNDPGDLLVFVDGFVRVPALEIFLLERLPQGALSVPCDAATTKALMAEYVRLLKASYDQFFSLDDDMLPAHAEVYAGIGSVTAAMTGRTPIVASGTTWCQTDMSWDEIDRLRFDPDNPWVTFALWCNQALASLWQEDFWVLPYMHRSPLDSANGIRGDALFEDVYLAPERVAHLIDWCADWIIQMERHLQHEAPWPVDWGTATWGMHLPAGGTFVNGDPVDLIRASMQPVLNQASMEKVYAALGGGLFHHHGIGLHQVSQVAQTRGMLIQEVLDDPGIPSTVETMLEDERVRDEIVQASLHVPIMVNYVRPDLMEQFLPIAREGRFILVLETDAQAEVSRRAVERVHAVSNLG